MDLSVLVMLWSPYPDFILGSLVRVYLLGLGRFGPRLLLTPPWGVGVRMLWSPYPGFSSWVRLCPAYCLPLPRELVRGSYGSPTLVSLIPLYE